MIKLNELEAKGVRIGNEKLIKVTVNALESSLIIDPKTALFIKGTSLDYSNKLVGGGFKFDNPNAKSSCSCGESFSI